MCVSGGWCVCGGSGVCVCVCVCVESFMAYFLIFPPSLGPRVALPLSFRDPLTHSSYESDISKCCTLEMNFIYV